MAQKLDVIAVLALLAGAAFVGSAHAGAVAVGGVLVVLGSIAGGGARRRGVTPPRQSPREA